MPPWSCELIVDGVGEALLSSDGVYRYALWREFTGDMLVESNRKTVLFVMLNPSTADASIDDPTIRRCMRFAKSWGFDSLAVGNLFAYRSTDYRGLLTAEDPVGPENDTYLGKLLDDADVVVVAWGAHAAKLVKPRAKRLREMLAERRMLAMCLGRSKGGAPRHPLMLGKRTPLEEWS